MSSNPLSSSNTILKPYDGLNIPFTQDGYLNATVVAAHFGKLPNDYLRTPDTQSYINQLRDFLAIDKNQLVISKRGASNNGGGTWLHRKLAIPFARWCDVRFSIWCDQQIELILSGELPQAAARNPRLYFAAARIARGIDLARDAGVKQALVWELQAIHAALRLPFPAIHLFGKDAGQMQLEV